MKSFIKDKLSKLDRSSKVLLTIGISGALISALGWLIVDYVLLGANGFGDKVADVKLEANDTRLKRTGNIHWVTVSGEEDAYNGDLVFTGEDSSAKVTYPSGDKVALSQKTLVVITKEEIALKEGTIDLELTGGKKLNVNAFGKRFAIAEGTKLRLVDTAKEKRIVPLAGPVPSLAAYPTLAAMANVAPLGLGSPAQGANFAKHPLNTIPVSLKSAATAGEEEWLLEFSSESSFSPLIHSYKTKKPKSEITSMTFPEGIVFWRATNKDKTMQGVSHFFVHSDIEIELAKPARNEIVFINGVGGSVDFRWTNPIEVPQQLQISKNEKFNKEGLIYDQPVKELERQIPFTGIGNYFWRVGYKFKKDQIGWSEYQKFKVLIAKSDPKISVKGMKKVFDFGYTPQVKLKIKDDFQVGKYQVEIYRNGKSFRSWNVTQPKFRLSDLPNGKYSLKVRTKLSDNKYIQSVEYKFKAKNSKVIAPPKLRSKNKKIFVKLLEKVINIFIPSAIADETVVLEWEKDKADEYEIVVSDKNKILEKKKIKGNSFKFLVSDPGNYYWKLRRREGKAWSQFTEKVKIEAVDKVLSLTDKLMVSEIWDNSHGHFTFRWKEPYKDLEYFLELYSGRNPKPFKTFKVKNGVKKIKVNGKGKRYFWRVYAKSKYGNLSPNKEVLPFKLHEQAKYHVATFLAKTSSSQTQKIIGSSTTTRKNNFSGLALFGDIETESFVFKGYDLFVNLAMKWSSQADGDADYVEREFKGELGYALLRSLKQEHIVFLGAQMSFITLDFDDQSTFNYTFNYFTFKYKWVYHLNSLSYFTAQGKSLLFINLQEPRISIRGYASYNHSLEKWVGNDISASFYFGFERNSVFAPDVEGTLTGDLDMVDNNIFFGVGVNKYF